MPQHLKSFIRDRTGVSAIEFAMLAPVMIMLLLGTVELADVMTADRKVTSVASTAADLVAQSISVDDADIDDIFTAATAIMNPYSAAAIEIRITSVNVDGTTTEVGWGDAYNTSAYAKGSAFVLPAGIATDGASIIVGEVKFTHTSVIGQFLGGPKEITDIFYMQPRRTLRVVRMSS
jgi:Flp pilus assembly protein TadG